MRIPTNASPCSILIHLQRDLIWVQPPSSKDTPSQDQVLAGVVEIECLSDRAIDKLEIRLCGMQKIAIPEKVNEKSNQGPLSVRYEDHVVLDRTLTYTSENLPTHSARTARGHAPFLSRITETDSDTAIFLERGVHDFEFHFIIPAWCPPFERCRYAHTHYTITAMVDGAGLGRLGAPVSASREVVLVQQQTLDNGPLQLDMLYDDVHPALGYMTIAVTSASLTVGGIVHLYVVHPNPPPNLNVLAINVIIEQKYELYNKATGEWMPVPTDTLRVWDLGIPAPRTREMNNAKHWAQGLLTAEGVQQGTASRIGMIGRAARSFLTPMDAQAQEGITDLHGYQIKTVLRLPNDRKLRPSTMQGTRTNIRISHELGVDVLFSLTDKLEDRKNNEMYGLPKTQVFSMVKKVRIPSCECTFDAIHLPPYSEESPSIATAGTTLSRSSSSHSLLCPPATIQRSMSSASRSSSTQSMLQPPMPFFKQQRQHGPLDNDWSRLMSSLTSLSTRSHAPSRNASLESSPTRPNFFSRNSSSNASRVPSPPLDSTSGYSTPVVPVLRPNDTCLQSTQADSQLQHTRSLSSTDRSAPRALLAGSPWAVSHLPPRTGESHDTCNCGLQTEELIEAEERLLEGAPTAPGAWIQRVKVNEALPPWTPSTRPKSPTHNWYETYMHGKTPFSNKSESSMASQRSASTPM